MAASIRLASAADAPRLLAVYAPYIEHTAVTFEYDVPGVDEFAARVTETAAAYPYLLCEREGEVLGYAYAHRHMARAAYGWNVETSVYLAPDVQRQGIGTALYRALTALLERQNVKNLYACVTLPNKASERLHEKMGFSFLGAYHKSGWKNGAWHDVGWFEKRLGGDEAPRDFIPLPRLCRSAVDEILEHESKMLEK
ncbi:MAG: GNAT family N-acetyltransferase [Eubacteriales bacterium]|nr:GNAT family N-acetyltransferase [Eubacteriales bacterium]